MHLTTRSGRTRSIALSSVAPAAPAARLAIAAAAALLALVAVLLAPRPAPAANDNFIFLGRLDAYSGYNDVWGYRDPNTGQEYAILGTRTGTSIVNVSDPFSPRETGFIPGPQSIWRDMHTYQGRAYMVSEGTDSTGAGSGLQIVSLANPEAPFLVRKKHTFTAHTIWIDEAAGVAYCNGASGLGTGFKAYNLAANPDNPPLVTDYGPTYIHDIWVGGGVAYTADIYAGGQMRVLDVSALPAGSTITQDGIATYASGATHNTWPHPDGVHVLTTDEMTGGTVRVWDVSDLGAIVQVGQFATLASTSVHNVYMKGDTAYCSWYAAGIRAFDVTDPTNPVLIGNYDTSPATSGFNGCWSVYPFLPSGTIPCADISEGLVLVAYADQIGTLSGTVTRSEDGSPIDSAIVRVPDFYDRKVPTDSLGDYAATLPGGLHTVIVSYPGYLPDTAVVSITDAAVTVHDVALVNALTGVGDGAAAAPVGVALSGARPNPARDGAAFDLALTRAAAVRAAVVDASGRVVRTLSVGTLPAGRHALRWDGRDDAGALVAAGTYLYRLDAAGETRSAKVVVVR